MRWFAWVHDPDPTDDIYTVDYAYFLRDRDRSVRVEHERSIEGLFAAADWLQWLADAGFDAKARVFSHSEVDRDLVVFVARKR